MLAYKHQYADRGVINIANTVRFKRHSGYGTDIMFERVIGCFQDETVPGKIQHGSAWWFNDNKTGMQDQMISLGNLGLLGNFIGMLTDSRSFLSYARHDYFRRIACNLIGNLVENGEYPNIDSSLRKIVEGISYRNAVRYFDL